MKRNVLHLALTLAVICLFLPLVWLIVRIFAQDFPALGFASGALSLAISSALAAYVVRDMAGESKFVGNELENRNRADSSGHPAGAGSSPSVAT
ncbi:MAG TPA: hypothetical protein VK846_08005 [Candidatus Limnocylindria bacterium]|nr:hypothetical protein [Candidatus Limnocylindria bacterium]